MTESQVAIIKRTWKQFRGMDPSIVGDAFYSKLFSESPALRKLFPINMESQYRKLLDMLNTIVARLDKPGNMESEILAMALRHRNYGVRPAHYKLVGNALLWTLATGLGNDWNQEAEQAWMNCYKELSEKMINASIDNQPASAG